ncbi:MAG: energy-coupling factor ABC transporter ATP-binding protein [Thaumarchaeota archaeon]|nr:energy-coupling factor ABC transporter ATP-binding protein [Nitrososphaerota archaeon]
MESAAELIQVSKSYGSDSVALRNVTLSVPRNAVSAVFGPNGAGKSTLMRIVALLEDVTSGQVKVLGSDTKDEKAASLRGRVAMVFQNPAVLDRNVYDNIAYGLGLRGIGEEEVGRAVRSQAEALGLSQLLTRNAKTLSGGQKQRVVIARTLAIRPELILLDEPNASLDNEGVHVVKRVIKDLSASSTIIVSTPNLDYALSVCSNFVLIDKGEALFSGSKEDFVNSDLAESYRY